MTAFWVLLKIPLMIMVSYEVATERQPMVFSLPLAMKYQQS